jgi:hypothetical protein
VDFDQVQHHTHPLMVFGAKAKYREGERLLKIAQAKAYS